MTLAHRVFSCRCGHLADRDANAAANLADWGHTHQYETSPDPRTPKQRSRATKARRRDGADQHPVLVKPARKTREPTFTPHPRPEPTTPEKGGADHSPESFDTLYSSRSTVTGPSLTSSTAMSAPNTPVCT
jgi:putative transposase